MKSVEMCIAAVQNEICIVDCGVCFRSDELFKLNYAIPDYHHLIRMNKESF